MCLLNENFQPIQKGVFVSDEIGSEALKPHFPLYIPLSLILFYSLNMPIFPSSLRVSLCEAHFIPASTTFNGTLANGNIIKLSKVKGHFSCLVVTENLMPNEIKLDYPEISSLFIRMTLGV